jgi:hypothetical protein
MNYLYLQVSLPIHQTISGEEILIKIWNIFYADQLEKKKI